MSNINSENADEIGGFIKQSLLHLSDPDFDDKLMQRIVLISERKAIANKNIRLSWIFLILSVFLFPLCYIVVFKSIQSAEFIEFGLNVNEIIEVIFPAGIILFSAIILLQIDNLFQLTVRNRYA